MLIIFQILFILFSLFTIINVIAKKKEGYLDSKGMVFWILFWIILVLVIIWPNSTQIIADHIGIGRGVDLGIYISVAVMFYLLFRLNVRLDSLNRDLTKIVRKRAIDQKNPKS